MTGQALALQAKDGQPIRKGRVSPVLASAIVLIVHEALSIEAAAQKVGLKRESLSKALKKPHVRSFTEGVKRAWLESRTRKAWLTVAELADTSASDKVRLEAAKTILTAAGELSSDDHEADRQAVALIQFIRNETHVHGQPLTQRLPGVVQSEDIQEAEYEPLDPNVGLTPSGGA